VLIMFKNMKLLQALREKIYLEQTQIADKFAKAVGFNGTHDTTTVIEREHVKDAWKFLVKNKQLLIDSFPKENIKKLLMLDTIDSNTDLGDILICFKQILRSQKARLISRKRYDWNTQARRQSYSLEYRIISATPNKQHPNRSNTTPQDTQVSNTSTQDTQVSNASTQDTQVSNTSTQDTQVSDTSTQDTSVQDTSVQDTKVSDTNTQHTDHQHQDEKLPDTVTMSAKRKLSPTPDNDQHHTDKKQKCPTPQTSNINVSPAHTIVPHNSPSPPNTDAPASPLPTDSPTPQGGLESSQVPVDLPQIVS
jgi:hypothetical protein